MEKQNDYFLNLLGNPTFSPLDFNSVGLSVDNTSIQDKSVYLNSNKIKDEPIFKDKNGNFDQSRFDEFYNLAKTGYDVLTQIKTAQDIGDTWKFYKGDFLAPKNLVNEEPEFKIEKTRNPLRQQEGFVSWGLRENPTRTSREIAQTQLTQDPETGEYSESPNDSWFDNFINPKVYAQWDEDGTHIDPITGETVQHQAGELKLNENGTYYTETLGNRNIYGRKVLTGFDTLTTDGSKWNKLDFFDSDDIEKSTGGSLMRTVAQIAPAFGPTAPYYIGARILLSMSELIPTIGKIFTGSDNQIFSKMEAFNKMWSFSSSDHVEGSNELGIEGHPWSAENGLKLIADVFTQLAEQRWIFKYGTAAFSELNPKLIGEDKAAIAAQEKWIDNYIANKLNNKELIRELGNLGSKETLEANLKIMQHQLASTALKNQIQTGQKLASELSMAYMTGITTASAYGEAKEEGLSDIEAALFTLGYTAAEYGLLKSDLGQWILPEMKSERRHFQAIAKALANKEGVTQAQDEAWKKLPLYKKIFELGKKAYHNDLAEFQGTKKVLGEAVGQTISNMTSEALEETSEELLQDLSKALFNAAASLGGSDSRLKTFDNVFDRYALSFLGGAVGGGIAGALPGFRAARANRNMDQDQAIMGIVNIVQEGKEKEFLDAAYKMTLDNKYLSNDVNSDGTQKQGTDSNNKDLDVKRNLTEVVYGIKDILKSNGADLSSGELLRSLRGDLKYAQLATLAQQKGNVIGYYFNEYNRLCTELVQETQRLNELQNPPKTDAQERKERKEGETTENQNKELIKQSKERIEKLKDEILAYKDGRKSDEFIQDALFEMVTGISSSYIETDPYRYAESVEKKPFNDIPKERQLQLLKEFKDSEISRRELIHWARKVHIKNQEVLAEMMNKFNEDYFKNKDAAIKNFEEIFFGNVGRISDPNLQLFGINAAELAQDFLRVSPKALNPLLELIQRQLFINLDNSKELKEKFESAIQLPDSVHKLLGLNQPLSYQDFIGKFATLDQEKVNQFLELSGYSNEEIATLNPEDITEEEYNNNVRETNKKLRQSQANKFNAQLFEFLNNPEIQNAIIDKIKNAKYLLPTTKQALKEFFNSQLEIETEDEDGSISKAIIELSPDIKQKYLDALEGLPSSPVDEYLNKVVSTLRGAGMNISGLSTDIATLLYSLARAGNMESFSYDENVEKQINSALELIRLAITGLESAKTTIKGDLSDLFGFNATINEIRKNRGTKTRKAGEEKTSEPIELAMISDDVAALIQQDLARYAKELEMYKAIYSANSQSMLSSHDNTLKNYNLVLNDKLNQFIGTVDIKDWEGVDELKSALSAADITEVIEEIKGDDVTVNDSLKQRISKARQLQDMALYNFFQKNKAKLEDREALAKFLKPLKAARDVDAVLDEQMSQKIPDRDFVWYLAQIASANPDSVAYNFKESISGQYAPIVGQEEAVKRVYSFLLNPKTFENFAKAHNSNLDENDPNSAYLSVDSYRSIFIEGLPGSGKTSSILTSVINILKQFHQNSDILKNVIFVSNSKENARRAAESIGIEGVTVMSKAEYMTKISNNYKYTENLNDKGKVVGINGYDTNGMQVTEDELKHVEIDGEDKVVYANTTVNTEAISPSLVIIDEATSLSQQDAALHEEFLSKKGIYSIMAGDFDQLGAKGLYYRKSDGAPITISQVPTNYITTLKLGQVFRGENESKINNILKLRNKKKDFVLSLTDDNIDSAEIPFTYYLDENGLYGDMIVSADLVSGATGLEYNVDDATKQVIDTMLKSLQDGETFNYIYDSEESPLYKYLSSLKEWGDKIKPITAGASQSQEGQYYIVDLDVHKTGPDERGKNEAGEIFSKFYTAISRAKQATLIFDREGNTGALSQRIQSGRLDRLVIKKPSTEAITNYGRTRKQHITNVLPDNIPQLVIQQKQLVTPPPTEPETGTEDTNEDGDIDVKNQRTYTPDVDTEDPDKMNMMVHTVMCQETGCQVSDSNLDPTDPKNVLILGGSKRIDSVNGLVKSGIIQSQNGQVSGTEKEKALKILSTIRNKAIYGKNKTELHKAIAEQLGVTTSDVRSNFIFKSCYDLDKQKGLQGNFLKWAKSKLEKLTGIFAKTKDSKSYEPRRQTFSLEIFLKDSDGKFKQRLEIPIAILTSPETLLQTKGYEQLNEEFNKCKARDSKHTFELFRARLQELIDNKQILPHIYDIQKLVQIYTTYKNFVVRFGEDFMLNDGAKLSGILLPAKSRGTESAVFTQAYDYEGEPIDLDEYKRRMPQRSFSDILENAREDILDKDGNVAIKKGSPFILMSDAQEMNDQQLLNQYIKQLNDPDEPKLVTRVYLYLPKGSVEDFLFNMESVFKNVNDEEDENATEIDKNLGNQMSSYRLLQFIAKDGSNFESAFNNWIDNGTFTNDEKTKSHENWNRLKDLMSKLDNYESKLVPKNGKSVSKQMLELLDSKVSDIRTKYPDIYSSLPTQLKVRDKNTLRTLLQYEFRKLMYSSASYGPSLKSQLQDIKLQRVDGKVVFQDYQQPRVKALLKDLPSNFNGILYHTTLKNTSEDLIASSNGNTYRLSRVNSDDKSKVSQRAFQINGKADTSVIILDSKPLVDYIFENATWQEGNTVGAFVETNKDAKHEKNTKAYLNGIVPQLGTKTPVEQFNDQLNSSFTCCPKNVRDLLQLKEGEPIPSNIFSYIKEKLSGTQYVVFKDVNNYKFKKFSSTIQNRWNLSLGTIIQANNELYFVNNTEQSVDRIPRGTEYNFIDQNEAPEDLKNIITNLNLPVAPSQIVQLEGYDRDFNQVLESPNIENLNGYGIIVQSIDEMAINPYQAAFIYMKASRDGIESTLDYYQVKPTVVDINSLNKALTDNGFETPTNLEEYINSLYGQISAILNKSGINCTIKLI